MVFLYFLKTPMVYFFGNPSNRIIAVSTSQEISEETQEKLVWLLEAELLPEQKIPKNTFVGPRASMLTPWSTLSLIHI